MKAFPKDIKFKFAWRSYQERVLAELGAHLDDNHLNVVAAPGSGKTVLGLEVMLRLNKPTLILAPSIAIRNQWLARFKELFLQEKNTPEWISLQIKEPKFLTISTYQGLHSALKDPENPYTKKLLKQNLKTIVIDEAHHLKKAWWRSLISLKDNIEKPTIVSLTATPPYDVTGTQWHNYHSLCGSIDAEISVPELVLKENLCPHQDYIYLNSLSQEEYEQIRIFRDRVKEFLKSLLKNEDLISLLASHKCIESPEQNLKRILEKPEYYSSICFFLKAAGTKLPHKLASIIGVSTFGMPNFDCHWAEILLTNFLYSDVDIQNSEVQKQLRTTLHQIGAIEKKKVIFKNTNSIKKILKSSLNKLHSITEIIRVEYEGLKNELRMVILTDFIRKEFLDQKKGMPLTKIGVITIFKQIRKTLPNVKSLAVLTGSIVIIPERISENFVAKAKEYGIKKSEIKLKELEVHKEYLSVSLKGEKQQKIVQIITALFEEGKIKVLIGTKSLLGEGWDAPSINSLILASFVGSYVLSNQMRGRAIRQNPHVPNKTANIWHLVSVEPDNQNGGFDFMKMKRRFKAFVGLSFKERIIENRFERMDIKDEKISESYIERINKRTRDHSLKRHELKENWMDTLNNGKTLSIQHEVQSPKKNLPRKFVFFNTIQAFVMQAITTGGVILTHFLHGLTGKSAKEIMSLIFLGVISAFAYTSFKLLEALHLFLRHGPIKSSMRSIGNALLKTLCKMNAIKTNINNLNVRAESSWGTGVSCHLDGGTTYEKSLFLDAMEELLSPINNPRYLLVRKNKLFRILRKDYHTVPSMIAANKKWAQYFNKMWSKYVGDSELIYTRSIKGRRMLLKARYGSLSSAFRDDVEQVVRWK